MNAPSISRRACAGLIPVGLVTAAALAMSAAAQATPLAPPSALSKVDGPTSRTMTGSRVRGTSEVIVKVDGALTASRSARLARLGADITCRLPIIQSVALRLPARNLKRLAALPFVEHVSGDGRVQKTDAFTVGSSGAGYAYQRYALTGAGVGVAVLDSGIRYNRDLQCFGRGATRITGAISYVPDDASTDDTCGHGTHVAGIIAGDGTMSTGTNFTRTYYGVARQANLVNVRVLDKDGGSSVSTVILGLQWVLRHRSDDRAAPIRVVNLSLGHPVGESYTTDPICRAVETLWKAGIVVVCAAGNGGRASASYTAGADNEGWGTAYGSIQSPANDPYVITVGATKSTDGVRADDKIATYSGRGPSRLDLVMKPDIVAPGNKVVSLYSYGTTLFNYNTANGNNLPVQAYQKTTWTGNSTDYFQLSGTSMAAPVVAGAAALMLQADPALTPDTVKARLMLSADKWYAPDGTADPLTYGAGYLDIPAALASTAVAQGPAASPAISMDPATGNVTVALDHCMWGSSLWGTGVADMHALWGSHCMWGSATVDASHCMWGSSALTFSHAMWGSSAAAVDLTSTALHGE